MVKRRLRMDPKEERDGGLKAVFIHWLITGHLLYMSKAVQGTEVSRLALVRLQCG